MDKGSITIFIFCLGMANSLECHKCLINEGNCSKAPVEVCRPNQDACFTVIKKYHGLIADTANQGCGSSNGCRRYPMGMTGSLFRTMWCCSSNLCQPINLPVSQNGSQSGLECQSCIGSPAECGLTAPSRQCYGSADRCVQISQRFLPGEELEPVIKGCGNSSFQDLQVLYQIGRDVAFLDQKVCGQSNCNNRSFPDPNPNPVAVLPADLGLWLSLRAGYASYSGKCRCSKSSDGGRGYVLAKSRILAEPRTRVTADLIAWEEEALEGLIVWSRCQNLHPRDSLPKPQRDDNPCRQILIGQPNGLQCYSYRDSGHEERSLQKGQILRCTGAMNRCVRIVKGENKSTAVTIQRGCATESMCRRDTDIYLRLERDNSRAECCKSNLCNKAHSPTNPELVTILSLWLVLKVYQ